jgi:ribosomal protein L7/L12
MDSELIIIGSLILGVLIGKVLSANSNSSAKLLENKVDAIIEHLGVEFKPYKDTPEEVMSALKNGERIKAIKLYRQFSGLGLKEASDIISHIESSSKSVV